MKILGIPVISFNFLDKMEHASEGVGKIESLLIKEKKEASVSIIFLSAILKRPQ